MDIPVSVLHNPVKVAQYILRNAFSVANIIYNDKTAIVLYKAKRSYGRDRKKFGIYTAEEVIASITQHIPEKPFQMVSYYGWYCTPKKRYTAETGNSQTRVFFYSPCTT